MKKLTAAIAVCSMGVALNTQANFDYVCKDAYEARIEKYEKSIARKVGRIALPTAGVVGTGALMVQTFGAYTAYLMTIWSPGIAFLTIGGMAGSVAFDLLEKGSEIVQAKNIIELAQYSEDEIREQYREIQTARIVKYENARRANIGLSPLTEAEIESIRNRIDVSKRTANTFDQFVHRVSKKGKNQKFTYDEVREALLNVAFSSDDLCPTNSKGKVNPVNYKKLIKITKDELIR